MTHAVFRLRAERLAQTDLPQVRGWRAPRCQQCRVIADYCLCRWKPKVTAQAGMCLLMAKGESLKPSNTGWLIADVIEQTHAFVWERTAVDEALLRLLDDPQWQPYIVFPGEFVEPQRVVSEVTPAAGKRPLFILLDATWTQARKMFRKSPYLERFPVLSLAPEQLSRYQLRRSKRDDHFCTAEVAALCLALAGEQTAAQVLDAYLDVFSAHYLCGKARTAVDPQDTAHRFLLPFIGA